MVDLKPILQCSFISLSDCYPPSCHLTLQVRNAPCTINQQILLLLPPEDLLSQPLSILTADAPDAVTAFLLPTTSLSNSAVIRGSFSKTPGRKPESDLGVRVTLITTHSFENDLNPF